jgi:hypothetical protein
MLNGAHDRTAALSSIARMVVQNSTVISYDYVFRVCAIVFVLSIPTVFLLTKPKKATAQDTVVLE